MEIQTYTQKRLPTQIYNDKALYDGVMRAMEDVDCAKEDTMNCIKLWRAVVLESVIDILNYHQSGRVSRHQKHLNIDIEIEGLKVLCDYAYISFTGLNNLFKENGIIYGEN